MVAALKAVAFSSMLVAETLNIADPIPANRRVIIQSAKNHPPFCILFRTLKYTGFHIVAVAGSPIRSLLLRGSNVLMQPIELSIIRCNRFELYGYQSNLCFTHSVKRTKYAKTVTI